MGTELLQLPDEYENVKFAGEVPTEKELRELVDFQESANFKYNYVEAEPTDEESIPTG